MTRIISLFVFVLVTITLQSQNIIVSTLAGSSAGFADDVGINAKFNNPFDVAIDTKGNLYVPDYKNHKIRKITSTGVVTTYAGSTEGYLDGIVTAAQFSYPASVVVDDSGNLFVTEYGNDKIRKISPSGVVSTYAGSTAGYADDTGTAAKFNDPAGIAIDHSGNLYVADSKNNRIRKISPDRIVTTLAGSFSGYANGTGSTARFYSPADLELDAQGNIFVADAGNHKIRKITPNGYVTTLAGNTAGYTDGFGIMSQFFSPSGITLDKMGNIYVAEAYNHKIRKITPIGLVSTLAGSTEGYLDGSGTTAKFYCPIGLAVDASGNIYVADNYNNRIRKITVFSSGIDIITKHNNIQVYPNPTHSQLCISNLKKPTQATIYNANMQEVLKITISPNINLPVVCLEKGVYILQLENYSSIKFIKE
jgi:sugar lactone lactonase YvrE